MTPQRSQFGILAALGILLLAAGPWSTAKAQSPKAGTWEQSKPTATDQPKTGTWQPSKKGLDRLRDKSDTLKKDAAKYYKDSPNLQTTVEHLKNVAERLEDIALDKLPLGDAVGVLANLPDQMQAGLTVWLQKKRNDAAIAEDFDRYDRYDAFLSGLYGDTSGLDALQHKPTGNRSNTLHSGAPEQFQIKSITVSSPEIEEGQTTQLTVSVQSVVGGEVKVALQSDGSPIGPLDYVTQVKPGQVVVQTFNQYFAAPGKYKLLVTGRDRVSDDTAHAYVVVREKPKFEGQFSGTVSVNIVQAGKPKTDKYQLSLTVSGGDITGTALDPTNKPSSIVTIASKIKGSVDNKGTISGTWSYVHKITEPSGAIFTYEITAPLNGSLTGDTIQGILTCETKWTQNDVAERLLNAPKIKTNLGSFGSMLGLDVVAVKLYAIAYRNAPGQFMARRVKQAPAGR